MSEITQSAPTLEAQLPVDEKWWGRSMTVWGALLTLLSTVLPIAGPLVGLNITGEMVHAIGAHLTTIVQAIGGIIGIGLTIIGRVRATARLVRMPVNVRL